MIVSQKSWMYGSGSALETLDYYLSCQSLEVIPSKRYLVYTNSISLESTTNAKGSSYALTIMHV
jgi:hypothetical protein